MCFESFREQELPLWSSRKCRSGWEHESADEQSSVRLQEISEPLAETWWEIYWKPLSVQFSISIKSSPGAGFFPAGAEAHDKCFIITPTRGAGCSWQPRRVADVSMCDGAHMLFECKHALAFLASYFILWDKESDGKEGEMEYRGGHYELPSKGRKTVMYQLRQDVSLRWSGISCSCFSGCLSFLQWPDLKPVSVNDVSLYKSCCWVKATDESQYRDFYPQNTKTQTCFKQLSIHILWNSTSVRDISLFQPKKIKMWKETKAIFYISESDRFTRWWKGNDYLCSTNLCLCSLTCEILHSCIREGKIPLMSTLLHSPVMRSHKESVHFKGSRARGWEPLFHMTSLVTDHRDVWALGSSHMTWTAVGLESQIWRLQL